MNEIISNLNDINSINTNIKSVDNLIDDDNNSQLNFNEEIIDGFAFLTFKFESDLKVSIFFL